MHVGRDYHGHRGRHDLCDRRGRHDHRGRHGLYDRRGRHHHARNDHVPQKEHPHGNHVI